MYLFQLSVTDNLSDGIVLSVMYCSLTPLMPSARKPGGVGKTVAMAKKNTQSLVSLSSHSVDDVGDVVRMPWLI